VLIVEDIIDTGRTLDYSYASYRRERRGRCAFARCWTRRAGGSAGPWTTPASRYPTSSSSDTGSIMRNSIVTCRTWPYWRLSSIHRAGGGLPWTVPLLILLAGLLGAVPVAADGQVVQPRFARERGLQVDSAVFLTARAVGHLWNGRVSPGTSDSGR